MATQGPRSAEEPYSLAASLSPELKVLTRHRYGCPPVREVWVSLTAIQLGPLQAPCRNFATQIFQGYFWGDPLKSRAMRPASLSSAHPTPKSNPANRPVPSSF